MLFCWWREKGGHKEAKDFLKSSLIFFVLTTNNHVGARHCTVESLTDTARQSFNKQKPSNFYYCKVGPIWLVDNSCQNISITVGMTKSEKNA